MRSGGLERTCALARRACSQSTTSKCRRPHLLLKILTAMRRRVHMAVTVDNNPKLLPRARATHTIPAFLQWQLPASRPDHPQRARKMPRSSERSSATLLFSEQERLSEERSSTRFSKCLCGWDCYGCFIWCGYLEFGSSNFSFYVYLIALMEVGFYDGLCCFSFIATIANYGCLF